MSTAAIVGGSLAGSLATGIIGSKAAGHAADTQAAAANNAAQLERQSATDALNFNKLQYGNSLNLLSPYYNTGVSANSRLGYLMGLNPAQGLPPGVVNPNAPQNPGTASRFVAPDFSGMGSDQVLPAGRSTDAGGTMLANRFSSLAPTMRFNGTGAPNAGINPGAGSSQVDPSATSFPGNPDLHNFNGGNVVASTNQGGTAQVPRTDGGGDPNVPAGTVPGGSFGSLAQGWNQTFQSPTDVTEQNDPGYKFRLEQGQQALQNSAAARGGLLSGGTAKALTDYNQNAASGEYSNVYNRALQNYNTNYNTFTNDQTNLFNRLSTLAGQGQVSANNLSASGITAANNAANIGLTSAGQIGQQLNNAGAANASGYVNSANAINGAIGGAANSLSTLALLKQLQGGSGA